MLTREFGNREIGGCWEHHLGTESIGVVGFRVQDESSVAKSAKKWRSRWSQSGGSIFETSQNWSRLAYGAREDEHSHRTGNTLTCSPAESVSVHGSRMDNTKSSRRTSSGACLELLDRGRRETWAIWGNSAADADKPDWDTCTYNSVSAS